MCLLPVHGHDDTLAGCEAIGLDHDGCALLTYIVTGGCNVGEGGVGCGRDVVPRQEILAEGLGALQLGGLAGRAKAGQPGLGKPIDDPGHQGHLGADDGQADRVCLRKCGQRLGVLGGDVDILDARLQCGSRVARGNIDHIGLR